ncbi:MAG: hypothetical protein ACXWRE_13295 [Pseudobdellovibrionaceae bacterium]
MKLALAIVSFVLGVGSLSEARDFYDASFSISASYAQIESGSETYFDGATYTVRYSDDYQFCFVYVNNERRDCRLVRMDSFSGPTIEVSPYLIRELFDNSFNLVGRRISNQAQAAFRRLIHRLPDVTTLGPDKSYFYQLDDCEPEALHVKISRLYN